MARRIKLAATSAATTDDGIEGSVTEPTDGIDRFNGIPIIDVPGDNDSDIGGDNSGTDGSSGIRGKRKYTRRAAKKSPLDLTKAAPLIIGIHAMLAKATGYDELNLELPECEALAEAGSNVLRHYNVKTTQKAMDWIMFAVVAGGIYGTRAAAIAKKMRVDAPPITAPSTTVPSSPTTNRPMMPSDFAPPITEVAGNA